MRTKIKRFINLMLAVLMIGLTLPVILSESSYAEDLGSPSSLMELTSFNDTMWTILFFDPDVFGAFFML